MQKANTERVSTLTVLLAPAATPQTYTTKPYTDRGKSFRKSGYYYQIGGRYRNYNLAKLQKANTERGNALTVFLAPAATLGLTPLSLTPTMASRSEKVVTPIR